MSTSLQTRSLVLNRYGQAYLQSSHSKFFQKRVVMCSVSLLYILSESQFLRHAQWMNPTVPVQLQGTMQGLSAELSVPQQKRHWAICLSSHCVPSLSTFTPLLESALSVYPMYVTYWASLSSYSSSSSGFYQMSWRDNSLTLNFILPSLSTSNLLILTP